MLDLNQEREKENKAQMMQQIENDKMVGFNPTIPIFK